jgi:prepilin-type N-terminal cleavage/methylation domain-containing protein
MTAQPAAGSRKPDRGFTMIEVMVAILLTALTVIGVLGLYRIESRASSFSRRETEAAVLAQDKLEELRTQVAPASASMTGSDSPIDEITATSIFSRSWSIEQSTSDNSVYNITVTVSWSEDGITRTVEVIGQRGTSS